MANKALDKLISRIRTCFDYHSLYAMEDAFNLVGLTIQSTPKNKTILCKISNGKPLAKEVGVDYIFLGSLDSNEEYSERVEQKIIDFVLNNASKQGKVKDTARVWRNGLRVYEGTIALESEDIDYIADFIQD
jgi:hypothetical protein